jgi:hypothetical protein
MGLANCEGKLQTLLSTIAHIHSVLNWEWFLRDSAQSCAPGPCEYSCPLEAKWSRHALGRRAQGRHQP